MANFWNQYLTFMATYLGIIILTLTIISLFMGGLFWAWFKVKISRGKLLLVKSRTISRDYFRPGLISEGFLIYKNLTKEKKRIAIPEGSIYRAIGVFCIDVDDTTNSVIKRNREVVSGFDAVKFEDLFTRALYKPALQDTTTKIILIIIILVLILCIWNAYGLYSVNKSVHTLQAIGTISKQAAGTIINAAT